MTRSNAIEGDVTTPKIVEVRGRPDGVSDELVEAIGAMSEAFECVERARGHLYSFHQLMGRSDLKFGEAADQLEKCGAGDDAELVRDEVVGRNAIDGRWSFQIVEEFDDLYYEVVRQRLRDLEERHLAGLRHLFESEMKERRRTAGRPAHEARPSRRSTSAPDGMTGSNAAADQES